MDDDEEEETVEKTMIVAEEAGEDTPEEAAAPEEEAAAVSAAAPVAAADAPLGSDISLSLAVQSGRGYFMYSSATKASLFGVHTKRLSITHPKRAEGALPCLDFY